MDDAARVDGVSVPGLYWRIILPLSRPALGVAAIIQFTYGGANTNDEWAVVDVGSGYYRITNRLSAKSVEVASGSTADSAAADQRTYSGATYQQFQLISVP